MNDLRERLYELIDNLADEDMPQVEQHLKDVLVNRNRFNSFGAKGRRALISERKESFKQRTAVMWRLYLDGETLKDIGEQYGLSKQRVAQIFEKAGYETRSRSYRKVTGNEIIAKEETP